MNIENNEACFVRLWLRLERTRRLLGGQYKRFCIRNVLKAWFGNEAGDELIWQVCRLCEQEGYNELPVPSLYPLKHRELLRAIVAVRLGKRWTGRIARPSRRVRPSIRVRRAKGKAAYAAVQGSMRLRRGSRFSDLKVQSDPRVDDKVL